MLNIVYPYKIANNNDLKFSLRSLKYLKIPYNDVYILGDKPKWLKNTKTINHQLKDNHQLDTISKLYKYSQTVGGDFILMNDDFFLLKNVKQIKYYYHESILDYANTRYGAYKHTATRTYELLVSAGKPTFNFSLHVPIILNSEKLIELIRLFGVKPFHLRSLYCNYFELPKVVMQDVKIKSYSTFSDWRTRKRRRFLSTSDSVSRNIKFIDFLLNKFPEKSYYEK